MKSKLFHYIVSVSEMQQEQQAKTDFNFDDFKKADVLALKRKEAREIYQQFRQLSEKTEPGKIKCVCQQQKSTNGF